MPRLPTLLRRARPRPGPPAAGCPSDSCPSDDDPADDPDDDPGAGSACCRPALALALAFAAGPSVLGGCEEFQESRPTCRRNASSSTRNASINTACSASRAACSTTNAANSS